MRKEAHWTTYDKQTLESSFFSATEAKDREEEARRTTASSCRQKNNDERVISPPLFQEQQRSLPFSCHSVAFLSAGNRYDVEEPLALTTIRSVQAFNPLPCICISQNIESLLHSQPCRRRRRRCPPAMTTILSSSLRI